MKMYHKIQSIYKRDEKNNYQFIVGDYSLPEFEYLKDCEWVFTEKVDGTNIRIMWNGKNVTFGGKTDNAQLPMFLIERLNELFEGTKNRKKFKEVFDYNDEKIEVCLYGEGYGAKIQKGGGNYISDGVDFVLFDVLIGDWWLQREDIKDIAKKFNLKVVPVIDTGTLDDMVKIVRKGFGSNWGDFTAEGIVAKPKVELKTRKGERIITKVKHKDFK